MYRGGGGGVRPPVLSPALSILSVPCIYGTHTCKYMYIHVIYMLYTCTSSVPQIALPKRMGGMGLGSVAKVAHRAAYVASFFESRARLFKNLGTSWLYTPMDQREPMQGTQTWLEREFVSASGAILSFYCTPEGARDGRGVSQPTQCGGPPAVCWDSCLLVPRVQPPGPFCAFWSARVKVAQGAAGIPQSGGGRGVHSCGGAGC